MATKKISFEKLRGSGKAKKARKADIEKPAEQVPAKTFNSPGERFVLDGNTRIPDEGKRMVAHDFALNLIASGMNRVHAYRATVECKGLTPEAIRSRVRRLMEDDVSRRVIDQVLEEFGEKSIDLRAAVKADLISHLHANVLDLYSDDGERKTMEELKAMPLWFQRSIREIGTVETVSTTKDGREYRTVRHYAKLYDKHKAAELLAKIEDWIRENPGSGGPSATMAAIISSLNVTIGHAPQPPRGTVIEGEKA